MRIPLPKDHGIRIYADIHTILNVSWYTYLEQHNAGVSRFLSIKFAVLFFVLEPTFHLGQTKESKAEEQRIKNIRAAIRAESERRRKLLEEPT